MEAAKWPINIDKLAHEEFALDFTKAELERLETYEQIYRPAPYKAIKNNLYLTKKPPLAEHPGHQCTCGVNIDKERGTTERTFSMRKDEKTLRPSKAKAKPACGDTCHNRLLFIECTDDICSLPNGDMCRNRQFQRREYQDMELQHMPGKGFGLLAKSDIKAGSFVIEYIGEVVDDEECERRLRVIKEMGEHHFYLMEIERDAVIDAQYRSNEARFINHSCDPNCETQKWNVNGYVRVGIFAIKDIALGEEVTFDYRFNHFGEATNKCKCGTPNCSGAMKGKKQPRRAVPDVKSLNELIITKAPRPTKESSLSLFKRNYLDTTWLKDHGTQGSRLFIAHEVPAEKEDSLDKYVQDRIRASRALVMRPNVGPVAAKEATRPSFVCGGIADWSTELAGSKIKCSLPSKVLKKALPQRYARKSLLQCRSRRLQEIAAFAKKNTKWTKHSLHPSKKFDSECIQKLLEDTQHRTCEPAAGIAEPEEDINEDLCHRCGRPGNLILCDGCPSAFHLNCSGTYQVPGSNASWFCLGCRVKKKELQANQLRERNFKQQNKKMVETVVPKLEEARAKTVEHRSTDSRKRTAEEAALASEDTTPQTSRSSSPLTVDDPVETADTVSLASSIISDTEINLENKTTPEAEDSGEDTAEALLPMLPKLPLLHRAAKFIERNMQA